MSIAPTVRGGKRERRGAQLAPAYVCFAAKISRPHAFDCLKKERRSDIVAMLTGAAYEP